MPLESHVKMRFYSPSVKMTVMTVESGSRATNTGATHTILGMVMPVGTARTMALRFSSCVPVGAMLLWCRLAPGRTAPYILS